MLNTDTLGVTTGVEWGRRKAHDTSVCIVLLRQETRERPELSLRCQMDYEGLVVSVATKVSSSLNLETKNQTLAKQIITESKGRDYQGFKDGE